MAQAPQSKKSLSLWQMLPNLLTISAICAGMTAIRFAMQGRIEFAVFLILVAAILDGLDGRLARLLKTESEIGAELDSLADFMNFGVATGIVMYLYGLQSSSEGWILVLIYAICCVMRLARFNVDAKARPKGEQRRNFVGVPSPAGALLVMFPLFVHKTFPEFGEPNAWFVGGAMLVSGLMMISRVPTPSLKSVTIPREYARFLVLSIVGVMAVLFTWPWATLAALNLLYLGSIVWTWRRAHVWKDMGHKDENIPTN